MDLSGQTWSDPDLSSSQTYAFHVLEYHTSVHALFSSRFPTYCQHIRYRTETHVHAHTCKHAWMHTCNTQSLPKLNCFTLVVYIETCSAALYLDIIIANCTVYTNWLSYSGIYIKSFHLNSSLFGCQTNSPALLTAHWLICFGRGLKAWTWVNTFYTVSSIANTINRVVSGK